MFLRALSPDAKNSLSAVFKSQHVTAFYGFLDDDVDGIPQKSWSQMYSEAQFDFKRFIIPTTQR